MCPCYKYNFLHFQCWASGCARLITYYLLFLYLLNFLFCFFLQFILVIYWYMLVIHVYVSKKLSLPMICPIMPFPEAIFILRHMKIFTTLRCAAVWIHPQLTSTLYNKLHNFSWWYLNKLAYVLSQNHCKGDGLKTILRKITDLSNNLCPEMWNRIVLGSS